MMNRTGLIALTSAAAIASAVACGTQSTSSATTPSTHTPAVAATSAAAAAPSACADLGGTVSPGQTCEVHAATPGYTIDFSYPVDYPDQVAVTDALKRQRDAFVDWIEQRPAHDRPYALDITGKSYRSGTPASGTQSLVFTEYSDTGGAHPVTYFESLNYDLAKSAPITFDTLFKPGTNAVEVLDPIVKAELDKRLDGGPADANSLGATVYQDFAITDDAVIFFIGQGMWVYEAAGPQTVSVPRTELASALA
jgi:hypothetical protein